LRVQREVTGEDGGLGGGDGEVRQGLGDDVGEGLGLVGQLEGGVVDVVLVAGVRGDGFNGVCGHVVEGVDVCGDMDRGWGGSRALVWDGSGVGEGARQSGDEDEGSEDHDCDWEVGEYVCGSTELWDGEVVYSFVML